MTISVALAILQRDGRWLLQLRDDIDSIIYPATGVCSVAMSSRESLRLTLFSANWRRKSAGSPQLHCSPGSAMPVAPASPMCSEVR